MLESLKALSIEDDYVDFRALQRAIKPIAHSIDFTHCVSMKEVNKIKNEVFDIVFVDLNIVDRSGVDFVKEIIEVFPYCPIIGISGFQSESIGQQSVALGFQDYFDKNVISDPFFVKSIAYSLERFKLVRDLKTSKESIEKSLEFRTIFLAKISHEIRTPLNGIIGSVEILSQSKDSQKDTEIVRTLATGCRKLLAIVNDLLVYTKYENKDIPVVSKSINIENVLKQSFNSFKAVATLKNIEYEMSINPSVVPLVKSDKKLIYQVLDNLISNAIKFTGKGGVRVELDYQSGRLIFKVSDTGPGIGVEDQKELFELYKQSQTGVAAGGTGLGLAISSKIAKSLGGELKLESKKGSGSTFTFSVPVEVDLSQYGKAKNMKVKEAKKLEKDFSFEGKVLIVDDSEQNVFLLSKMCESLSINFDSCLSGEEALELVVEKENSYDLIFMDCRMPGLDGLECSRIIKKHDEHQLIAALTANAFKEDEEKCLKSGMDFFISKPLFLKDLKKVLNKVEALKERKPEPVFEGELDYVDHDALKELRVLEHQTGSPGFVKEMVDLYKLESKKALEELYVAAELNTINEIKHYAHKLKGLSRNVGGKKLAEMCEYLEVNFDKGADISFKNTIDSLPLTYETTLRSLNNYMDEAIDQAV